MPRLFNLRKKNWYPRALFDPRGNRCITEANVTKLEEDHNIVFSTLFVVARLFWMTINAWISIYQRYSVATNCVIVWRRFTTCFIVVERVNLCPFR